MNEILKQKQQNDILRRWDFFIYGKRKGVWVGNVNQCVVFGVWNAMNHVTDVNEGWTRSESLIASQFTFVVEAENKLFNEADEISICGITSAKGPTTFIIWHLITLS